MSLKRFEELHVWQRSQDLAVFVYARLSDSKDFRFKAQITAACVSIFNNIAEGFEQSPRSIKYAISTLLVTHPMRSAPCRISLSALKYLLEADGVHVRSECEEISKMLNAMIEKLKLKVEAQRRPLR
jgi:hypothetical protein